MSTKPKLLNYKELLAELQLEGKQRNHLLLGNGFNNSLGVLTSHKDIFEEMEANNALYTRVSTQIEEEKFNIEAWIRKVRKLLSSLLESQEVLGIDEIFLNHCVEAKIKLDFMKATYNIVSRNIKNIRREKSDDIYLLFKNFTNYFTLNYDPFLYLLLLRFKKDMNNRTLVIQERDALIKSPDQERKNIIYEYVKNIIKDAELITKIAGENLTELKIRNIKRKNDFKNSVRVACLKKSTEERWDPAEINTATDTYLTEASKSNLEKIPVIDGFRPDKQQFIFDETTVGQNVIFLHGAFQIVDEKNKNIIRKITKSQNKKFIENLEKILDTNGEEVICVLTGESGEKLKQIKKNRYLKHGFDKLGRIAGNVVIFGSSLAKNDAHIFEALRENENINTIYISTSKEGSSKTKKAAEKNFADKQVKYFDYNTVDFST